MAYDTAARPHELLNLKIKDIKFKISSDNIQYAEITVDGKTGPRTLPLIDSIPYIKEWILNHPNAYLSSMGKKISETLFYCLKKEAKARKRGESEQRLDCYCLSINL